MLIQPVSADPIGDQWLARIDQAAKVKDAHLILDVRVTDSRGRTHPRTIEIWQKGDDKRLVRMISPARLAGIGLLVTPGDTTHLFLPQYPPAKRIVGSKKADAFMGTDFAIEDLSRMTYGQSYTATLGGEHNGLTQLILKSSVDRDERNKHLWVDQHAIIHRVEHLDDSGAPTRTLDMSDVREVGPLKIPHHIRVTDLKRNRVTEASIIQIDVDSGIQDAIFSVTQLERQ
jgi:outer membrane lipoprotein-sorting protein